MFLPPSLWKPVPSVLNRFINTTLLRAILRLAEGEGHVAVLDHMLDLAAHCVQSLAHLLFQVKFWM